MTAPALLIGGTDTGVGKTYVACALARGLVQLGLQVGVMKPCETGVPGGRPGAPGLLPQGSDADRLVRASGCVSSSELVRPYAYPLPAAPAVAARQAGSAIETRVLDKAFAALREAHDVLLVEASGGLLVPLAPALTVVDLAARWRLPLLLVARTGLGTLNHTALSLRAAHAAGLRVLGVVLSSPDGAPSESERQNLEALESLISAPVLMELPAAASCAGAGEAASTAAGEAALEPDDELCLALAQALLARLPPVAV
ncbi:MAG: dethiobiotin synthase [Planctomycetota bacterium]|nr:MAG: dethiobiotin synthase [Planctomycetota bacterium]